MLVRQELVNKIKDLFGLNVYETKVWLALLSVGIASAGKVATISGVPRSRTYDVLESLEKRGFAIAKLDKPVKYLGVKPKVILEKLKNNVEKDAKDRIVSLSKIRETEEYEKITSLYDEGMNPVKKEDISASLKGKSNISSHLREIIQNATKEVVICTSAEDMNSKSRIFQQTFKALKENKIKIMIALSGEKDLIKELEKKFEVKIKKMDIDAKVFVVDRKEILFYTSKNTKDNDIAIWLNSEFFAEAFASMLDITLGK
jgi:sugar-specific transcriptional regulator TrmB